MMLTFFISVLLILTVSGILYSRYLPKKVAVGCSWVQGILFLFFTEIQFRVELLPIYRMLYLITVLFLAMKIVAYTQAEVTLSFSQYLCFLFLWIGMDPTFCKKKLTRKIPNPIILTSLLNIFCGIGLLVLVHFLIHKFDYSIFWGITALIAISMIFHFGLINLWAIGCQQIGWKVRLPFSSPLKAHSLAQFWGKLWNVPFVEMTSATVYRPIQKLWNKKIALLTTFLFSGILHEIAITFPVQQGYGGPLLYFAIQGIFVGMEKQFQWTAYRFYKAVIFAVLLLPLPLLFPTAFIKQILLQPMACLFDLFGFCC